MVSLVTIVSCSFLDEKPIDRLTTTNFYTNAKDAQAAIDAIYGELRPIYVRNMFIMCDLPTDVMKNGLGMPNPFLQDLEFLRHNSENTFVRQMWERNYSGIMKANTAINNIPSITMESKLQERYIAEAKFLRSLFYFNLVRFFGDVPIVEKLESIDDAMGPRISKEKVYELIISDLSDAENILPLNAEYSSSEIGRATKGAAKILLGKVYLTKGDYNLAKNKLGEVIENESNYGYGLHQNYGFNWDLDKETGVEAVFYIEYKPHPLPSNGAMDLIGPKYSIPSPIGVSNSNEADIPTQELYDSYMENDSRRDVNLKLDFKNPKTGEILTSSIPLFGKYYQEGLELANQCEINFHIIRYADAVLMYAEALNELGESSNAHKAINRIRERAFGNGSQNLSGLSKDEFRTAILNERFLEFPFEGHRWFDLSRTGTFVERMKAHSAYEANVAESNKTEINKNLKDYMILMPIPQREIDLNGELVQNPGW